MTNYGVAEAKNNFTHLLERVESGERITITRHGKPVAELVRPTSAAAHKSPAEIAAAFERLRIMRERLPPADKPAAEVIRELRDDGF